MVRLALIFLLVVAGCTTSPLTGRSQYMVVSDSMAVSQSAAAYTQMMGDLNKKKQIETGTPRVERVREITERLIAQAVRFRPDAANWNWEVQVINDPKTVNAFCMAGGKMAIYTGMWEQVKATDDEIAQVMGHEIAHALADHTRERMSIAMTTAIGTQVAAIALASRDSGPGAGLALTGAQLAAVLAIQLPNSRESESEADQIGLELAARAGYDPKAAVTLWDKMGKQGGGKAPPQFLSTHPSPQNRAAKLGELGARVQPLYVAAKANPVTDAPHFLGTKEGSKERAAYVAKVAKEREHLTLFAEAADRFTSGGVVLECRSECAQRYNVRKSEWRRLHQQQQWRELAASVIQAGYLSDLSYFMLGEAARGMGHKEAADTYYQRAVEAGARYGCGADCDGFDVQKGAHAALGR
jgi:predicted Zn-dependent protease